MNMSEEEIRAHRKRQAMLRRKEEREEKKSKARKVLLLIVVFIIVFIFSGKGLNLNFKWNFNFDFLKKNKKGEAETTTKAVKESALKGKFIAYVPIDNRSIHTNRVIYLAESSGYELKMPDSKFYRTYLASGENSYASYTTKYGNPSKIASWLLEMEDAGCDYYILSLDQLFSGGIVGSQYLTDKDFDVYERGVDAAQRTLNKIMEDKNNHVYLIDSIMGLTITPGFKGVSEETSLQLKEFSNQERLDVTDFSIDKIAENYILAPDGKSYTTNADLETLNAYLAARERKLNYSKYIMEAIGNVKNQKNIHLIYGIDDSGNSSKNIQENDIAYVKSIVTGVDNRVYVRDGVSSLSEQVFAKMLMDAIDQKVSVRVRYYGDRTLTIGQSSESYSEYMEEVLSDIGLESVDEKGDIEVLVYTKNAEASRENSAKMLINQYLSNVKKHIPTIIINDAEPSDKVLVNYLIDYESTSVPLGYMIGYSSWNGFVHSSRIAVSEGVTRYLYLTQKDKDDSSNRGHMKALSYGLIEDIAYNLNHKDSTDLRQVEADMNDSINKIVGNLNKSNMPINLVKYEETGIHSVDSYNYKFPWSRPNEISFDVSVTLDKEAHTIKIPTELKVKQKEA